MKNLFDDNKLPLAEEFYKKATFFSQKDEIDTLESSIDSAPLGNYHEIVGDFENKVSAYFLQDLVSYTVLSFLKVNKRKFMLNSQKQGELLKTCIMMMFMQAALVVIMVRSIYCDWLALLPNFGEGENGFELFMAKFFTTTTVHLMTYRYFKNGL